MRVVLFHPVLLPPKDYGGVERVVLWLAQGLLELGHEVYVAALSGSRLPHGAKLIEMQQGATSAVDLLARIPAGTDVVHFMAPPEEEALPKMPCASLLTVHGNGKPGEKFIRNTVFLTQDHARRHGGQAFVYNGVNPDEYVFDPKAKSDHYLFLSKTSWKVKNVAGAIRRCHQAGVSLWVAGGNRPWPQRLRVLFEPRMRWQGPVAGRQKADLLARARALVFPILWPEPFGLVMVESLISGTPVIASRLGSTPEIVSPEVGELLDPNDDEAWVSLLSKEKLGFEPERCRAWAIEKFTHRSMAASYAECYRKIIAGEYLNSIEPRVPLLSSRGAD